MTRQMAEEEKFISKQLKEEMDAKNEEFKEIVKNDPNKRIYKHKLLIEWKEVIEVKKDDLRFEENAQDRAYNKELISKQSSNYGLEVVNFAKQINDIEKFAVCEFLYAGNPFPNSVPPCCGKMIEAEELPQGVKKAIVEVLEALAGAPEETTHDDIINEEIEQEHAEAELRANTGDEAVDSFLNGETDELPEGAEEISEEEAVALAAGGKNV